MSFLQVMQMQMPCPYGQKRNSRAVIVYARLNLGHISSQLNVQDYVRLLIVLIQNPSIPFEIQLIKSQQSAQIFWALFQCKASLFIFTILIVDGFLRKLYPWKTISFKIPHVKYQQSRHSANTYKLMQNIPSRQIFWPCLNFEHTVRTPHMCNK